MYHVLSSNRKLNKQVISRDCENILRDAQNRLNFNRSDIKPTKQVLSSSVYITFFQYCIFPRRDKNENILAVTLKSTDSYNTVPMTNSYVMRSLI
jgi:hypothetical protein